mmetsp:Transcript_37002/g.92801  ORF Transcript_37002/g.92801 Transcript_37002/m.92801 type:complete len:131 (+) Transcript_37002:265-657(+)
MVQWMGVRRVRVLVWVLVLVWVRVLVLVRVRVLVRVLMWVLVRVLVWVRVRVRVRVAVRVAMLCVVRVRVGVAVQLLQGLQLVVLHKRILHHFLLRHGYEVHVAKVLHGVQGLAVRVLLAEPHHAVHLVD